jgi:hypothetical protein
VAIYGTVASMPPGFEARLGRSPTTPHPFPSQEWTCSSSLDKKPYVLYRIKYFLLRLL